MAVSIQFEDCARLPNPGDNVAIATRFLDKGLRIETGAGTCELRHTLLEGHRFAIQPIDKGSPLLSWGLPFGVALAEISPGDYVCNDGILDALRLRKLPFDLPTEPNFKDRIVPHEIDPATFTPGTQVDRRDGAPTFDGYRRPGGRGNGTRNAIVLLGTSSRTASFVRALEARFAQTNPQGIDGIVAVAHTEGGGRGTPNNAEHVHRTLGGFMVHPNVGAVLAVDYGIESMNNSTLADWATQHGLPLNHVPYHFLSIDAGLEQGLDAATRVIEQWIPEVAARRTAIPVGDIKIALQCGGSDSFSGISGNPLAAWVAREVIRYGGSANLAETDELIGAEAYVLQNVRDLDTARRFVSKVENYKALASWHGTSAEGNPSGGNKYRGLYNIVLKSIGAAMKRHPEVRLDDVIDYGQRMTDPGYYFMDSPGNDLESIAGQVASGCNVIFFVTGNGSITNFPFVPTLKVVTTSERYGMLSHEMDVNAGAYLDGESMGDLGSRMFDKMRQVASGELSKGEEAGHAQVSLWRNWRQTDTAHLPVTKAALVPDGTPLPLVSTAPTIKASYEGFAADTGYAADAVGLILPTSLCSGQIARMAAERFQEKGVGVGTSVTRYAALVHTEGCGVAGDENEEMYTRTMLGYLTHPLVRYAFILEHGCEKTHNDFIRHHLEEKKVDGGRFGWGSIQLDGGIERVMDVAEAWFSDQSKALHSEEVPLGALRIGLAAEGPIGEAGGSALAALTQAFVGAGATVVVPESSSLLGQKSYWNGTVARGEFSPTIAYGQSPALPGFHVMACPTSHWVETLTGLGGTGVDLVLVLAGEHGLQGHPLVPVVQVSEDDGTDFTEDVDLVLGETDDNEKILRLVLDVASRRRMPRAMERGLFDFQFTRGLLGVSM